MLISGFQKCHFYYCPMPKNAPNRSLKNDVINKYGYLAMFAKNRYINLKFVMLYAQVRFYNILHGFLKILDFGNRYLKMSVFLFFGKQKTFFGKSEIAV